MKKTDNKKTSLAGNLCEILLKILRESSESGKTVQILDQDEAYRYHGCFGEPLYATPLLVGGQKAVLLHYGADPGGLWTGALLIPENNFNHEEGTPDGDCEALRGIEWFLFDLNYSSRT